MLAIAVTIVPVAPTLSAAGHYLSAMFLLGPAVIVYRPIATYLTLDALAHMPLGLVVAFAPM
jgi:hypothetical protein